MKHRGFHQDLQQGRLFEDELADAIGDRFFHSTGYYDVMRVNISRESPEVYDDSTEWYVMIERGETIADGNNENKR